MQLIYLKTLAVPQIGEKEKRTEGRVLSSEAKDAVEQMELLP